MHSCVYDIIHVPFERGLQALYIPLYVYFLPFYNIPYLVTYHGKNKLCLILCQCVSSVNFKTKVSKTKNKRKSNFIISSLI